MLLARPRAHERYLTKKKHIIRTSRGKHGDQTNATNKKPGSSTEPLPKAAMQREQPQFQDIAALALPWLKPKLTNDPRYATCGSLTCLRCCRTDILTPLWLRLRNSQRLAQYQQATQTCRAAQDPQFWITAEASLWNKNRRAWQWLFPDQEPLPKIRPARGPFRLPQQDIWAQRPFPPRPPGGTARRERSRSPRTIE